MKIRIGEDIFGSSVTFFMHVQFNKFKKTIERHARDTVLDWGEETQNDGLCLVFENNAYIWVDPYVSDKDKLESTLDHEIGHAMFAILKYYNINIDDSGKEEVYLYMKEYYFSKIKKKIRKNKK